MAAATGSSRGSRAAGKRARRAARPEPPRENDAGDDAGHALVEAFAAHLATRASRHTREAYLRDARELAALADAAKPAVLLDRVTGPQLRRFLATLHAGGLSGRSLARILSSWRALYRFLGEEGKVE